MKAITAFQNRASEFSKRSNWQKLVLGLSVLLLPHTLTQAAEGLKLVDVLKFKPVQRGVEYQTPTPDEYDSCKIEVEKKGKSSGWVVLGPQGEVMRRFTDTNGDNVVDQWKYYQFGIEVYRDLDSNYDKKVDQSRWLNTAGSKWGIDNNADGKVDVWKTLSAEEASRVAVEALISNDPTALKQVMLTSQEIKQLGISTDLAKQLLDELANVSTNMKATLSKSKSLNSRSKWIRFDATSPGTIPADEGKANRDLLVYENAMSIVESNGETILVQVGEIVKVGDVWKLTSIPRPLVGDSLQLAGGLLMQPSFSDSMTAESDTGIPENVQKLLDALQKLDMASPVPTDGAAVVSKYNAARADILSKLVEASSTSEEKNQWLQQMIDGIAAAVQTGGYPEGLERLKKLETSLKNQKLHGYLVYRRILAEYSYRLNSSKKDEDRRATQSWWLEELEKFANAHETSSDAAEAMFQLALAQEFSGEVREAKIWYEKIAKRHSARPIAKRASGALKRLNQDGKPFSLQGANIRGGTINTQRYKGKTVLVLFWTTWSTRCLDDIPVLKEMYAKYRSRGFEIIGVNIDIDQSKVGPFISKQKINWPQIYEPGGDESAPATEYGVIMVPTMFLVGADGKVVSRPSSVDDLSKLLPEQLNAK